MIVFAKFYYTWTPYFTSPAHCPTGVYLLHHSSPSIITSGSTILLTFKKPCGKLGAFKHHWQWLSRRETRDFIGCYNNRDSRFACFDAGKGILTNIRVHYQLLNDPITCCNICMKHRKTRTLHFIVVLLYTVHFQTSSLLRR